LAYLLLQKEERMTIVRKEERKITTSGNGQLTVEHLSPTKNIRSMLVQLPPGASTGEAPHAHEGEEVHFVIKGTIYAEQGEYSAECNEGDSFSWNACTPHYVKNIGDELAIVLISIYTETEHNQELL
jgi:quercetin dioxygenase-like cupin family protein